MKYLSKIFPVVFMVLFTSTAFADDNENQRYRFYAGFGGYSSGMFLPGRSNDFGSALMFETQFKTRKNFNVGVRFLHANSESNFREWDTHFDGQKRFSLYNRYSFTITKPLKIGKSQEIELGTGIVLAQDKIVLPSVYLVNGRIQAYLGYQSYWDIGCDITLHYKYSFPNNFFVGVHASATYYWASFIEGLVLSPTIGIKF
jgi:hypothetical protein